MPVRWAVSEVIGRAVLMVLTVVVLSGSSVAEGQLLNLDSAAAPPAGEGRAVKEATRALDEQIKVEEGRVGVDGAGAEGARLRLSVSRIARGLFERGEGAGPAGSEAIVRAYTLLRAMPEVDGVAALIEAGDRPDLMLAGRVLADAAAHGDDALDARAVRDGIALLIRLGAVEGSAPGDGHVAGWLSAPSRVGAEAAAYLPGSLGAAIDAWEKSGVDAETIGALRELAGALDAAAAWPAYRREAAHLGAVVVRAGGVVGPADAAVSRWLTPEARAELGSRFCAAAKNLGGEPEAKARAFDEMHRLAVIVEVSRRLTGMNPPALVERPLRDAWLKVVGAAGARADEALLAFAGAVALADARRIDESEVTREAKPACRTLEARAKRTQMDILEALSRMGSPAGAPGANADPMGDPALVGAVAGHKQVLADLHAIGTISSAIGAGKPGEGPPDATSKIAPRVLRLGQEFGKPDHPDPAIRALRALAVALEDGAYLKSDGVVHGQALAGWVKVTGGKGAQLSGTAQGSIEDYLSLWSADAAAAPASPHGKNARTPADIQREVDSAAERLHLLRRLVERQVEGATLERMTSAAGAGPDDGYVLQSWPGWEMPAPVLGSLCTGLNERLAGATELAIAGRNDELRRALGAIDKAYSAARLAAALEVRFEGAGLARCAAMAELAESAIPSGGAVEAAAALGIAEETWFGGARGAIADVCRYAPEYAVLLKTDAKKAERLRAYIELRGADAMKAIQER